MTFSALSPERRALVHSAAAQETELSIEQIVPKHIAALGGAEKLSAIQNVTMTGKASLMEGQLQGQSPFEPNARFSMRMEMSLQGQTFVQAFDGTTGGLGMLGIMSYFNHLPRLARPRTLVLYFDPRNFMPGGEGSWPQFDYYTVHPERLKPIVATLGIEHIDERSRD
jgi:hypothetical protein